MKWLKIALSAALVGCVAATGSDGKTNVPTEVPSVADLSGDEIAALREELFAWKASDAGQEAERLGLVPAPKTSNVDGPGTVGNQDSSNPMADQIQRLLAAKQRIKQLSELQPRARFSLRTPYALMWPDEFAAFVNSSNVGAHRDAMMQRMQETNMTRATSQPASRQLVRDDTPLPTEVDWQRHGCVTPVKNQGSCGVCWVFAAIGALESGHCVHSGNQKTLHTLSEQQVVSCGPNQGTCRGGWAYVAYDWILRKNGGSVCTESGFPYGAAQGGDTGPKCPGPNDPAAQCNKPELDMVSYVANEFADHEELERVVAKQPVAVQLLSGVPLFQYYTGGVLMGDQNACPARNDHEVLIVGYGERDGVKYWKIKNSWSRVWGEEGYGYLERGYQGHTYGTCGIERWGYYPVFRDATTIGDDQHCEKPRYGKEILGRDLKEVTTRNEEEHCCEICRREPGCKAVTWHPSRPWTCRLKATIEGERRYRDYQGGSVVVVKNVDKEEEEKKKKEEEEKKKKEEEEKKKKQEEERKKREEEKRQRNSMCLTPEKNVDYPGNDLSSLSTKTPEQCCDACSRNSQCGAYTWSQYNGGSCFLKTRKPDTPRQDKPLPNGSAYFVSGETYRCGALQRGVDFPGGDLSSAQAVRPEQCCGICRKTRGCGAFSWNGWNGGTCWLKRRASYGVNNPYVTSASL
ncbi:hypothetical protein PINS_up021124 [Pythium insidiosum]|nr:hypothetical protein PINS_up021124 [Pythium insidiosum]